MVTQTETWCVTTLLLKNCRNLSLPRSANISPFRQDTTVGFFKKAQNQGYKLLSSFFKCRFQAERRYNTVMWGIRSHFSVPRKRRKGIWELRRPYQGKSSSTSSYSELKTYSFTDVKVCVRGTGYRNLPTFFVFNLRIAANTASKVNSPKKSFRVQFCKTI